MPVGFLTLLFGNIFSDADFGPLVRILARAVVFNLHFTQPWRRQYSLPLVRARNGQRMKLAYRNNHRIWSEIAAGGVTSLFHS
jgi:hypothetical protein